MTRWSDTPSLTHHASLDFWRCYWRQRRQLQIRLPAGGFGPSRPGAACGLSLTATLVKGTPFKRVRFLSLFARPLCRLARTKQLARSPRPTRPRLPAGSRKLQFFPSSVPRACSARRQHSIRSREVDKASAWVDRQQNDVNIFADAQPVSPSYEPSFDLARRDSQPRRFS